MKNKILVNSLLVFSFALIVSCSTNKAEEGTSTVKDNLAVNTTDVKLVEYSDQIRTTGRLAFNNEYKMSFKTGGVVESVYVKEGQAVTAGKVLASLKLNEIEAKTSQASIAVEKARRDYDRTKALYADSVATLEQLQNADSQLQNAQQNLQAAQFNQNQSKIIAPANGIIQKILVKENEITGAGNPIIIFGAENQGKALIANISDADVVKIAVGDMASLQFDPYPETVFSGRVIEIAGMANPSTGTYEVKIQVDDSNGQLRPGFIGSASLESSQIHNWKEIPVEALVSSEKRIGQVYILENGVAKKRKVRIERLLDDKLIISTGLSEGEKVVSSGLHRLTGNNIQVTNL